MVKIASLFSGVGGFEKGILQADPKTKIVFASEFDPESKAKDINNQPARIIYNKNFGEYPHGDIKKINATNVPNHEILCGGFPCQDVSLAGKRAGLCGAKSGLFHDIIRILREKQPELVFLENVPGLLSSNRGWDFARVIIELEGVGYTCEWQILNSKDFGVPQNRRRVYIIGHLRGAGTQPIFPVTKNDRSVDVVQGQYTNCLTSRYEGGQATGSYIIENKFNAQGIISHSMFPRSSKTNKGGIGHLKKNDGSSYCLDCGNNQVIEVPCIAGCLTGGGHSGGLHSDMTALNTGYGIRRLTPIECERLQGFPDNWTEGISDTQRYKCLGNAVTVPVIEFIANRLFKMMELK